MSAPAIGPLRAVRQQQPAREGGMWRASRVTARTLTALWAAGCLFVVLSEMMSGTSDTSGVGPSLTIGLSILILPALAVIPWRWEAIGGVLLILAGLVPTAYLVIASVGGGSDTAVLVASALIGLTPIVAGMLFLAHALGGAEGPAGRSRW
jgi:hypothetical protein